MSGPWVHKKGVVTVVIDRSALGAALAPTYSHVNRTADQARDDARSVLPDPLRRFVGSRHAGRAPSDGGRGLWTLRLRGRRYGSGTSERLMRGVDVPVALVTVDSAYAMVWEYGAAPVRARNVVRKASRGHGTSKKGRGRASQVELERQYQPLTLAAQRAGVRAVLRPRSYRRSR